MKGKNESESEVVSDSSRVPMGCSPPGSSVHGIFQARVLQWGAIAFSGMWLRLLYYNVVLFKEENHLNNMKSKQKN